MKKKKIIMFSILAILIGYIVLKIGYYYKPYKLGDIIDIQQLNANEIEIKLDQDNWDSETRKIFTFKDYETNSKIIDYLKNKKVRRYKGIWTGGGVSCDAEMYRIKIGESVFIDLLGSQYVDINSMSKHCRYKFYHKLDLNHFRYIVNKKTKEVESKRNRTGDSDIINMFPQEPFFFWNYKGANNYKYMIIREVTTTESKKTLSVQWTNSDITKSENYDDINHDDYDINMDNITHDKTIVIKAPLEIGNTWKTTIPLKVNDEIQEFEADIIISSVSDDTITTRLIVPNLISFLDHQYIEETVYKKGLGVISKKYNAPKIRFKDSTLGYELYGAYKDYPSDLISPEKLKDWGNELNMVYSIEDEN